MATYKLQHTDTDQMREWGGVLVGESVLADESHCRQRFFTDDFVLRPHSISVLAFMACCHHSDKEPGSRLGYEYFYSDYSRKKIQSE